MRPFPSRPLAQVKKPRTIIRGSTELDLRTVYCLMFGLALLAGVSFEPLWDFVDLVVMYM